RMQRISAEAAGQVEDGGQLVRVVTRDGGVDLYRDTQRLQVLHAINRGVEGARNAAERIVGVGVGAVERDGYPLDASFLDALGNVLRDQGAVGSQRGTQAAAGGIFRQFKNIGTIQRLAAAEHEDGTAKVGNLRDDVERFLGGQIGGRHQLGRRR